MFEGAERRVLGTQTGRNVSDDRSQLPESPARETRGAGKPLARPSGIRRWLIRITRDLIIIYFGLLIVLYSFQTRVIFPGASSQGHPTATVTPKAGTELVSLMTTRGERVVALFGPALTANGQPAPATADRPAMVYFYGNGDYLNHTFLEFNRFRRLGLDVLVPDYVGYGMSGGSASEKGCRATADAAYDYLVSKRGVDPKRVISAGWSLGGAVAIDLASRRQVGGLIAFSTFTSGVDMGRRVLPFVPVSLLLQHRFESLDKIAKIRCPTLIGHGRLDSIVPFWMGEKLAAKADGPVETLWLDRAEHNDFFAVGGPKIDAAIASYVDGLFRKTH
jgi:fermentation-respiration switch protein FrsA (DUF1100 family)